MTAPAAVARGVMCGSLACQKDSYLRFLSAEVLSCEAAKQAPHSEKKSKKKKDSQPSQELWSITLSDTVLFPEGGGQPPDHGEIGAVPIINVQNVNGVAVHTATAALEVGSKVEVNVNWTRRWDHMQQHSAQHLITATAIKLFGYQTDAWNLGEEISFLDLVTSSFTHDEQAELERVSNEYIRTGYNVLPRWIDPSDPEISSIRCRGLPDNVNGPIRVLEIDEIDKNLCCGTHIKNTTHLQAIKLLKVEKAKKNIRVYFVAGDRLLSMMGTIFTRQQAITASLAVSPENHLSQIDHMWKTQRESEKKLKALGRETATLLASTLLSDFDNGKNFACAHLELGDLEAMKAIHAEVEARGCIALTTCGPDDGAGMFMMSGPDELVKQLGPIAALSMNGKGGGKGRFQGKVKNVGARAKAAEAIIAKMEELEQVQSTGSA